jgi:Spy/CpxP family protein refolding chaperone
MKISYTLIFVVAVLCVPVYAQPFRMGEEGPAERIEQLRKVRLIEMLELKEDQSVRFFARLNEYEKVKRDMLKEKSKVLDQLERLVRNDADSVEFEKLFPEVIAIDIKIGEEKLKFFNGLSDILSAQQRGKLLLFERYFERELRDAIRDAQRRRHRMEEP